MEWKTHEPTTSKSLHLVSESDLGVAPASTDVVENITREVSTANRCQVRFAILVFFARLRPGCWLSDDCSSDGYFQMPMLKSGEVALNALGSPSSVVLEFNGLTFGTGGKSILNGVSGFALPGQVIAVMGPSGAGTL